MSALTIATTVIGLITKVLPLIPKGVAGTGVVGSIVDTLTTHAPLIVDQIGSTYTGVKNIVDTLGDHPATTADQLTALKAFNKQVDDAWDAVEKQLDPDA